MHQSLQIHSWLAGNNDQIIGYFITSSTPVVTQLRTNLEKPKRFCVGSGEVLYAIMGTEFKPDTLGRNAHAR